MENALQTIEPQISAEKPTEFDLKRVVSESKERINQAEFEPPRRRRGNPGGPRGKYKKRRRHNVAEPEVIDVESQPTGTPPPDIAQMIKAPIKIIGSIPAKRTGIAELALDDNETDALAQSLDQVFKAFVPDIEKMDPKTAAVLNCGIVAGSVFVSKYQIYSIRRAELIAEMQRQGEAQHESSAPDINNKIHADQVFTRVQAG